MGIATEILSLRRNQTSSVKALLAALEWSRATSDKQLARARAYAAAEAADIVLLNVAAHAAEALSEQPTIRRAQRAALPSRRKPRRSNPGRLSNQILGSAQFALRF
jgi:hypothetical protein